MKLDGLRSLYVGQWENGCNRLNENLPLCVHTHMLFFGLFKALTSLWLFFEYLFIYILFLKWDSKQCWLHFEISPNQMNSDPVSLNIFQTPSVASANFWENRTDQSVRTQLSFTRDNIWLWSVQSAFLLFVQTAAWSSQRLDQSLVFLLRCPGTTAAAEQHPLSAPVPNSGRN